MGMGMGMVRKKEWVWAWQRAVERSRRRGVVGLWCSASALGWARIGGTRWQKLCERERESVCVRYRENEIEFSVVGNQIFV